MPDDKSTLPQLPNASAIERRARSNTHPCESATASSAKMRDFREKPANPLTQRCRSVYIGSRYAMPLIDGGATGGVAKCDITLCGKDFCAR